MRSTAVGEVEKDGKVLVIKRIEVTYHLTIDADADADKVDRAFRSHPTHCPVYRSIHPQIEVTTVLDVDRAGSAGPTS